MLKQLLSDAKKTTAIFTAAALSAVPSVSYGQDKPVAKHVEAAKPTKSVKSDKPVKPARHVEKGKGVSTAEAYLKSIDGPGVVITIFPAKGEKRDLQKLVMDNTGLDEYGYPPSVYVEPQGAGSLPGTSFVFTMKDGKKDAESGNFIFKINSSKELGEKHLKGIFGAFDQLMKSNHSLHKAKKTLELTQL